LRAAQAEFAAQLPVALIVEAGANAAATAAGELQGEQH